MHPKRIELSAGGRAAIAGKARSSGTGYGGDDSVRIDLADAPVACIRNVDVPRRIHRHAGRKKELSAGGRAAVAGESREYRAGHGGDDTGRVHLADAAGFREVQVTRGVHRYSERAKERRAGGRDSIRGEILISVAGDCG